MSIAAGFGTAAIAVEYIPMLAEPAGGSGRRRGTTVVAIVVAVIVNRILDRYWPLTKS